MVLLLDMILSSDVMLWCDANGLIGHLLILSTAHCHYAIAYMFSATF